MRFRCYYCGRLHTVDESVCGKQGRCVCGKVLLVPALESLTAGPGSRDDVLLSTPFEGGGGELQPVPEIPRAAPPAATSDFSAAAQASLAVPDQVAPDSKGSILPGALRLLAATLAWGVWAFHTGVLEAPGLDLGSSHLGLPAAFWSAVLLAMGLGLFLDGVIKLRKR